MRTNVPQPTPYQIVSTQMLVALGATRKHVYGGTVPAAEVAKRRARNKRAKAARKARR